LEGLSEILKKQAGMKKPMKLPADNSESFLGIPLKGHICALRRGEKKYFWLVEGLIEKSAELPVFEVDLAELLAKIGNGTWFGKDEKVTIQLILSHIDRALQADLTFPIILSADGKVMDGSHRIMLAYIRGVKTLKAIQFKSDPAPDFISEVG
jgi:hypothetical protein